MSAAARAPITLRFTLPRASFSLAVDLRLPERGISVIYGASGSGKTSLLRAVAGLERPQAAQITVGDQCWHDDSAGIFVPTWQRPIGYVFQEASLLPHLNVKQNLRYGIPKNAPSRTLDDAIDLLDLASLLSRDTAALSGGERQRVAIARALATQPSLLLMDEPLASVDVKKRAEVMPWLERLRDQMGMPALYVTHNTEEVTRLADHLVVLQHGQVMGSGDPHAVLTDAALSLQLGDDLGALISGFVVATEPQWQMAQVQFDGGEIWIVDTDNSLKTGQQVRLRVHAKDISITLDPPPAVRRSSIQNVLPATVLAIDHRPGHPFVLVSVQCGGHRLLTRITRRAIETLQLAPNQPVFLQIKSVAVLA
jgi:molybdate transport system ATP-binding protein